MIITFAIVVIKASFWWSPQNSLNIKYYYLSYDALNIIITSKTLTAKLLYYWYKTEKVVEK